MCEIFRVCLCAGFYEKHRHPSTHVIVTGPFYMWQYLRKEVGNVATLSLGIIKFSFLINSKSRGVKKWQRNLHFSQCFFFSSALSSTTNYTYIILYILNFYYLLTAANYSGIVIGTGSGLRNEPVYRGCEAVA